ncbi:hypothetical protein WG906_17440 [Pedobacter sp. P351]|uniref:hypothetical protein n=1 Tax=Pedobacter superstes TaxID=3133441 RepID=UPI00309CD767
MRHIKHTLTLLVVSILFFASCSKDNDAPSTKSIILQGKWKVTLFNDNGAVETSNYSGYEFTFNSNGSVSAVKNNSTVNGTWNTGADENLNKLTLAFPSLALLELNEEWVFLEKRYTQVKLEHINSNGQTEVLILEKI